MEIYFSLALCNDIYDAHEPIDEWTSWRGESSIASDMWTFSNIFLCSDAGGKIEMWEFKFFDFHFLKKFFKIFQNILFYKNY
jgi:hypothetical protein